MYKRLILFYLFFIVFNVYARNPSIRIGIAQNISRVTIKSDTGFIVEHSGRKRKINNDILKFNIYGKNMRLSGRNIGDKSVNIYPEKGGFLEFDKYRFRGSLRVINNHGKLYVVNILDIEQYLYGVLANEILRSSPMESLKTLAVVCRTYALKNVNKHEQYGFDLCNTTHCQVYRGYDTETENIIKAVDSTRGIVITYEGDLISAYHHSACGGGTANNEDVWLSGKGIEYLRGRWCDFCSESPRSNWDFKVTMDELEKKFRKLDIGNFKRMSIERSDSFGRVIQVGIIGSKGQKIMSANEFRLVIGANRLWSAMFSFKGYGGNSNKMNKKIDKISVILQNEKKDFIKQIIRESEEKRNDIHYDGYVFTGHGSGHAVGLCQWGAIGLSKKGLGFKEIIAFYYKNTELLRIY